MLSTHLRIFKLYALSRIVQTNVNQEEHTLNLFVRIIPMKTNSLVVSYVVCLYAFLHRLALIYVFCF